MKDLSFERGQALTLILGHYREWRELQQLLDLAEARQCDLGDLLLREDELLESVMETGSRVGVEKDAHLAILFECGLSEISWATYLSCCARADAALQAERSNRNGRGFLKRLEEGGVHLDNFRLPGKMI
ncbi:MAG: hypothetical protein DI533_17280 [Cereibacter sphaeroides]|uniref:Uncharacterized protein n=1 Tax=Cereibacter sphaeroides TaxID=1063 RepID=A0A2W5S265_CERSP|nr:MAG: hypothetical protein DI533_17280 [Cereibacter sphaeroides]